MPPEGAIPSESEQQQELARRVDAIEAGYELMLAYAAQGLPSDTSSSKGNELRDFLQRFDAALTGLSDSYRTLIVSKGDNPATYDAFLEVLARDAHAAQAG